MTLRLTVVSLSLFALLVTGCASAPTTKYDPNIDYYRVLDGRGIYRLVSWCLRDYSGTCVGKSAALRASNRSGPDFDPSQDLTVLKWKMQKAGKSTGALQVRVKDDGFFYDTTINIDAVIMFGPSGVQRMEVKKIYGGDWAFSDGFVATVAVAGVAASVLSSSCKYSIEHQQTNDVRFTCSKRPGIRYLQRRNGSWYETGDTARSPSTSRGSNLHEALEEVCGCT